MNCRKFLKTIAAILASIVFLLLLFRLLFLPPLLEKHIDKHLSNLNGSYGITYSDFTVSIWKGSLTLKEVTVKKKGNRILIPLFKAEQLIFEIQTSSILKCALVSEITVHHPTVSFINGINDASTQIQVSSEWLSALSNLSYLPVNSLRIHNGSIHYYDFHSDPRVALKMHDVNLMANNLRNVDEVENLLSAFVEGSARADGARINVDMELNSFSTSPMFRLSAELSNLDLNILQDFVKAYGGMDVEQGILSLYAHASTRNNKVVGYVKPAIEDITIASLGDDLKDLKPIGREDLKLLFVNVSNRPKLKEIQFEENLADPGLNIWNAVSMTLHNAFIEGLMTTMETSAAESEPPRITKPKRHVSKVSAAVWRSETDFKPQN